MSKKLNRSHYTAISVAVLCFLVLYFGFDITPSKQKQQSKRQALNLEATSIRNLIQEARDDLGASYNVLEAMNMELNAAQNDSIKAEQLKAISGKWYELGYPAIAGYYAEEVAKTKSDEDSWALAGTTYLIGSKQAVEPKTKIWAFQRAVSALENAISINPGNLDHQINLAIGYVDNPPPDNPMKGILRLRDLNDQYPNNSKILIQLGRLSLLTNQLENAILRLKQAESVDPDNQTIACLLAETYTAMGQNIEAQRYDNKCNNS